MKYILHLLKNAKKRLFVLQIYTLGMVVCLFCVSNMRFCFK